MPISPETLEQVIHAGETASGGPLFETYRGLFYLDDELRWLEGAAEATRAAPAGEADLIFWCLFQAALAKRPYNLFHRANLDMRTRDVPRTFGNKKTWETPFSDHVRKFAREANRFRLGGQIETSNEDPAAIQRPFDLCYIDPPYMSASGSPTPYNDYYGFLDLLVDPGLVAAVDLDKKHRPPRVEATGWDSRPAITDEFRRLFRTHTTSSTLAVSYRSDGLPDIDTIAEMMAAEGREVEVFSAPAKYVLSKKKTREVLIVGR